MRSPPPPTDRALRGILLANGVTLVIALVQQWSILHLLWPFWIQSLIIGWYARRRILALQRFSTEGFTINERAVDPTPATQRQVANFFVLHFGGFHAAYLVFLVILSTTANAAGIVELNQEGGGVIEVQVGHVGALDVLAYLALSVGFWQAHRASHLEHVAADLSGSPNIGTLMFLPYARVVPMHLTIIAGLPLGGAVWLFMLLKLAADVTMHKVEHRLLRRSGRMSAGEQSRSGGTRQ